MPFHQHTLANGLQIIGENEPGRVMYRPGLLGQKLDHAMRRLKFQECHTFWNIWSSKGTPRRDSLAVNRDFSRIGADNNAFTSEENTVFHAAFLPEFLAEAVDVLADIMRPSLRLEDFTTEKKVILDEIVRYEVQPGWATYGPCPQELFRRSSPR